MSEVKKCPECGGELEKGYVIVDGLRWSREKHEYFALMTELVVYSPFILANLEGYRCQKCKLIEFHYKSAVTETPPNFFKKCVKCNENIPIASEYCPRCGAEQRKKKRCHTMSAKDAERIPKPKLPKKKLLKKRPRNKP